MTGSRILPRIKSIGEYRPVRREVDPWLPAMRLICRRHRLGGSDLLRFTDGTHILFRTGRVVIKLYCTLWPEDFRAEHAFLSHVSGLPVPEMVGHGEVEGWPYIIMSFLEGVPAGDLWDDLDGRERLRLAEEMGRLIARIRALPPCPGLETGWESFLRQRIESAVEHHGASGEGWRGWIERRVVGFVEPPLAPAVLHADITDEQLLLTEQRGVWRVTGLLDFGDAMMGNPCYEFIAPFCFYCFGKPGTARALVEASGIELNAELADNLTTWCLLHRFGKLQQFLDRHAVADGSGFERALWGDPD